jgi:NADPH:quinone reductase-like Zn-dependent oxidoreductase
MHAFYIGLDRAGARLERREVPIPEPTAGQILVRVHAAGLNRGELLAAHGAPAAAKAGGGEGAGTIEQLGPEVTGLHVGDRVMGRAAGCFAEYVLMDAREALPIPAHLSFAEAAAIPLTFVVVEDMLLCQGRLAAGEWLLVAGVSSGVGVAALQAGKVLGARVIGTSGSGSKLERLKALGLDMGLNTRKPDFQPAVLRATGGVGARLAVNVVGGSVFHECLRSLAFEGRLATVGHMDGQGTGEIDLATLHARRLVVFGVSNRHRTAAQRAETVDRFRADLLPAITQDRFRPLVDRVFGFDELAIAVRYVETDAHVGKVVVQM